MARLLQEMGFSLRVNHKKIESGNWNPPKPEERDRQFEYIGELREGFAQRGHPIVSVDTKKIERRLFSEISKNWAGKPLVSFQVLLHHLRTTKTETGLKVKACLMRRKYETGEKVSDAQMDEVMLQRHDILPQWNYTINPS